MLFKHAILTLAATILALPAGNDTAQAAEKVYRWRATSHQMVGTARYRETVVPFCEMVKKASNGRLIIEPYGAGVLFPVVESLDAVRDGVVQMGMVWSGFWASKHPVFTLASGRPGGPLSSFSENFYRAEKQAPLLGKVYEKFGVVSLGVFDFNPQEMLCSIKPIRSLADFKGKNIRTSGIGGLFYNKLGANVVSLSPPEIYQALQLGTVEAAEYNDWLVNKEMAFDEVTKYAIEPALHIDASDDKELIVNPDAWNSLPDDLKAIVIACRDMVRYRSAVAYDSGNDRAKQAWLDNGVEIITLPAEDVATMRKIGAELILELAAKDPDSQEYVRLYAEALHELGYKQEAQALGYKPVK